MRPNWIASCLRIKESRFDFRKCLRSRWFLRPPFLILARSRKRLRNSFQNRKITLLNRRGKNVALTVHISTPQLSSLLLGLLAVWEFVTL